MGRKFTPGPWQVGHDDGWGIGIVRNAEGRKLPVIVASAVFGHAESEADFRKHDREGERMANARLIASSPALFAACEWSLAYLCNPNTIDAHTLVAKLVDALAAAGLDKEDLDQAAMAAFGGKPWRPEADAKERVRDAAPDLLSACVAVVEECNTVFVDVDEMSPEWQAIEKDLRAAIAKATGEEVADG